MEISVVNFIFVYSLFVRRCLIAEVDISTTCVFNHVVGKCIHASLCSEPASGSHYCRERIGLHAFVCCPLKNFALDEKEVGDNCTNYGVPGTCVIPSHCKKVRRAIEDKKYHGLERCGFRKTLEVICCPGDDVIVSPKDSELRQHIAQKSAVFQRKSELACEYFRQSSPCLATKIVNGEAVLGGEFPHMASIQSMRNSILTTICGGSLISQRHVLTAAHCFVDFVGQIPQIIRLGVTNISDVSNAKVTTYEIYKYFIHPQYNRQLRYNDVAVIQLDRKVTMDDKTHNILPACLNTDEDRPALYENLSVAGWGITENKGTGEYGGSQLLIKTEVFIPEKNKCSFLNRPFADKLLCALGYKNSKGVRGDTCSGDSGGPLQSSDPHNQGCLPVTLFGVTSFGSAKCGSDRPAYYTNVYKYLDWIENITWPGDADPITIEK